jgi:hypothetical protein
VLEDGIPDDAFNPVTGDVKSVASSFKRLNRVQRREWQHILEQWRLGLELSKHFHDYAEAARQITDIEEETPADVRRKAETYSR